MHIYEDCTQCPFRELTGLSNYCTVFKTVISKRGILPKPFENCLHSRTYNEKRIRV